MVLNWLTSPQAYKKRTFLCDVVQLASICVPVQNVIRNWLSLNRVIEQTLEMISFILANVCFIIFIYNIHAYLFSRPKNFPPGKFWWFFF